MPIPTNPPYSAGAIIQPRRLNRWLDLNRVSKLTRAQTYFSIPTFSIAAQWSGYSELVAVFNYAATNNFSIKLLQTSFPISPNYIACIAWVDSSYNMHRYKLWSNTEVFYFTAPQYTNELIKKNFRIEIWTVAPTTFTQFTLAGAGTDAINGIWTETSLGVWEHASNPYRIVPVGAYLVVPTIWTSYHTSTFFTQYTLNGGIVSDSFNLYTNGIFPGGRWASSSGTNPPPYGYIPLTFLQITPINIYTSVLQAYDYRYTDDALLATTPAAVTALSNVLPLVLPATFPTNSSPTLN